MSAEHNSNPLAGLDYFNVEAVKDAEVLFGPVDRPAIEEVLASPVMEAQIAMLALTKSIRQSGDPVQNALANKLHETAFGLLTDKAYETHPAHLHTVAIYLVNQAIGKHDFTGSKPDKPLTD